MAAYSSRHANRSAVKTVVLVCSLLLVAGTATIAGLHVAGVIELPFLKKSVSHVGQVGVPLTVRPIAAYAMITREDILDPATGDWYQTWVSAEMAEKNGFISDPVKLLGRVVNHDKGPLLSFTEADLMPPGTRPGLVAGIPPGKRSLTLEAAKIGGIHGLHMGDRFDIVATIPPEKNASSTHHSRGAEHLPVPEPQVRVLVDNGMIVTPVHVRDALGTAESLTKGSRSTNKPIEEVVIALEPQEIPHLTAAISRSAAITAVARSGHPDDAHVESMTAESEPPPVPTAIETVIGTKRETLYFPGETSDHRSSIDRQPPRERQKPPKTTPIRPSRAPLLVERQEKPADLSEHVVQDN